MNTKSITVNGETKQSLEKQGVVVGYDKDRLPPHLSIFFDKQESLFDMHTITVDLDKYDDFHPIHAML